MTAVEPGSSGLSVARDTAPAPSAWYEPLLDRGMLPDWVVRAGIRSRLRERIARELRGNVDSRSDQFRGFVEELCLAPIAVETDAANQQHYEVPPEFFVECLGPRLKYSSCYYPKGNESLSLAEEAMLDLTCQRARLSDGMDVLDVGCGWGSLSLWIAEKYPNCRITSVSKSGAQRAFILAEAARRGLKPPEVITSDMNSFRLDRRFDRVLSVEMFEHMKNYQVLLKRIACMLKPDGLLFVHIFSHTRIAYHFLPDDDWIGRYFFTGGTMPSDHLLLYFQDDLKLLDHWRLDGRHYQRTANHWLEKLDRNRTRATASLERVQGREFASIWFQRWRVFFMACAELWGLDHGSQWIVSHYLFSPRGRASVRAASSQPS